jgi:hypothetical protein
MNRIQTHAKWMGLALLVSAIVATPAFARPASTFYTPQQLKAMSANWEAKGRLLGSPDAATFYTREQLKAMSANWEAKGRLLGSPDAATFYTREQLRAMSAGWAAKGRLLGSPDAASFYTPQQLQALSRNWAARARLLGSVEPATQVRGDGFDWGDFGIGAAVMLGLVLLGAGTAAAAHYGRRGSMRARPVS